MATFNEVTWVNGTKIEGLRSTDECDCLVKHEPSVLLGHLNFCGVFAHVFFIRVVDDDEEGQKPVCDPCDRWADLCALDDAKFGTTEIPGYNGRWVFYLFPGER